MKENVEWYNQMKPLAPTFYMAQLHYFSPEIMWPDYRPWDTQEEDYHPCSQFSHSGVSNSLWPHGLQHARPPYPSPTPGVFSNSCPSSQWCHPTISSSVVPFSSRLQSFPTSGSFLMSQLFASGGLSHLFKPLFKNIRYVKEMVVSNILNVAESTKHPQ